MWSKSLFLLWILTIILSFSSLAGAADELALKQQQCGQTLERLSLTNTQLTKAEADYQTALVQYVAVNRTTQTKQNAYDQANNDYERAAKNVDMVSPDKLAELARIYQAADKELKIALERGERPKTKKRIGRITSTLLKRKKPNRKRNCCLSRPISSTWISASQSGWRVLANR